MGKPTKEITILMTEYTGHAEQTPPVSKEDRDHMLASYKKAHPKASDKEAKAYVESIINTENKVRSDQHADLPKSWDGKVTFNKPDGRIYRDEFFENAQISGAENLLKLFDKNKDNFVDTKEISAVLNAIDSKDHARFEKLVGNGKVQLSSVIQAAHDTGITEKDLGKISPNYTLNVKTKSTGKDITFTD